MLFFRRPFRSPFPPTLSQIKAARRIIQADVRVTPTLTIGYSNGFDELPRGSTLCIKLEHLQWTGSFKVRGVLHRCQSLTGEEKSRGVTAISAGNHAIAVSVVAQKYGLSAKVIMPRSADPLRIALCEGAGAQVILVDNVLQGFLELEEISKREQRAVIHPFEGLSPVLGSATCGLEFHEQAGGLDVVVIAIGGGGLIAGIASAIKRSNPSCQIIGVEPAGANAFSRSLKLGQPTSIESVKTVADSLAPPMTTPTTFGIARQVVDQVIEVSDEEILNGLSRYSATFKFLVEPACAAGFAAVIGRLRSDLAGKRVGLVSCGSNISPERALSHISNY
jgi:threonine dehydratase